MSDGCCAAVKALRFLLLLVCMAGSLIKLSFLPAASISASDSGLQLRSTEWRSLLVGSAKASTGLTPPRVL